MVRLVSAALLLLGYEMFTGKAFAEPCCPGGSCPAVPESFLGPTPEAIEQGHVVPVDKGFDPAWRKSLFERGERKIYRGKELFTIGMPCGGMGAGQLYVRGDGTLAKWWIFNNCFNERGCAGYQTYRPESPLQQGFAVRVKAAGGDTTVAELSEKDFDAISFIGEYPLAEIRYRRKNKPELPVDVSLEVFSPWIPLNARDSANPATILRFTVANTSKESVDVSIAGWLQNGVCLKSSTARAAGWHKQTPGPSIPARSRNTVVRRNGLMGVQMDIVFSDTGGPPPQIPTEDQAYGGMTLAAMDPSATALAAWESKEKLFADLADDGALTGPQQVIYPLNTVRCGAVASNEALRAGETTRITFLVTWCFPNRYNHGRKVGQMYANWYGDSLEAADYIAKHFERLDRETHLFHDTYFDTTLPYWFVHRVGMPTANLATGTFEWWASGRCYGWEGVMCCAGTCTHVWHYEQATGRLFPELARRMRELQNLPGMDPKTGVVKFRGPEHNHGYAADGQAGVILMFYRQHLVSKDGKFLAEHWPAVKKMMQCMIDRDGQDGALDGIVNTSDHTTYDVNLEGTNGHNGSMYLAALRACEEMARRQGDGELAGRYRRIFESGSKLTVAGQFNGDYIVQLIPQGKPTKWQIGDGCLTSQLLGNGWTYQLALGPVYPQAVIDKTLRSIFRYNFVPDVGPYYTKHPPEMVFVKPGEAGLLICTYPLGDRLSQPLRYRNTIMQGYDYDAANQMLYRGMLLEGLAVYRANHDNYDGVDHNPWNEQQCGDHYARAMTTWGGLIAISGFLYDGPAAKIGFAPRFKPEDFKAFFAAAEGWGSLVQRREANLQTNRVEVQWGRLPVKTLVVELPAGTRASAVQITVAGTPVDVDFAMIDHRVVIRLKRPVEIQAGEGLHATLKW